MAKLELDLLAWVLTYLVHSSALLGAVWLATRALAERRRTRELLLCAAALGGLLTASAQVALGFEPLGGRLDLSAGLSQGAAQTAAPRAALGAASAREFELQAREWRPVEAQPAALPADPFTLGAYPEPLSAHLQGQLEVFVRPSVAGEPRPWATAQAFLAHQLPRLVLLGIAALALLGLLPLVLGWRALRRDLAGARELREGELAALWLELSARARLRRAPRLLLCPALEAPLTAGLLRPRVCIPERVVLDLAPAAQRALLAHELAHVERRDPLRALLLCLLERLLWIQPLNRLARRELEELAEHACDQRALELGVRPIELARCLTDVAGWLVERPRTLRAAPGMAARPSVLGARVRRLVETRSGAAGEPRSRGVALGAILALGAVCVAAPGFGTLEDSLPARSGPIEQRSARARTAPAEALLTEPAHPRDRDAARSDSAASPASAIPAPLAPFLSETPARAGLRNAPSSAALSELDALLALLDEELAQLEAGLFELRALEFSDLGGGVLSRPLEELETRLQDLRARRTRLAQLVPSLIEPNAAGSAPRVFAARPSLVLPANFLQPRNGEEPR